MVIGLTGFSGAGKSTVASYFVQHGFHHIDCDKLVHQEVYRDPAILNSIAAVFGAETVNNGTLDRRALRNIVMGNNDALHKLNEIVMPAILAAIEAHLQSHCDKNVILDAPLLFEYGLEQKCNYTVSIITDENTAIQRIMERDHLTEQEAKNRLAKQKSASYYSQNSNFVLKNNQDPAVLEQQVHKLITELYDQAL